MTLGGFGRSNGKIIIKSGNKVIFSIRGFPAGKIIELMVDFPANHGADYRRVSWHNHGLIIMHSDVLVRSTSKFTQILWFIS